MLVNRDQDCRYDVAGYATVPPKPKKKRLIMTDDS